MSEPTVRTDVYRVWVDNEQRIVSFHEVAGSRLLEFRDREMFLRCVDEYTHKHYRYQ